MNVLFLLCEIHWKTKRQTTVWRHFVYGVVTIQKLTGGFGKRRFEQIFELLTEIFGNQSNYCYFCRVANIFWSTNWWLGKLWGSSRSSVKTRWLRRWLGVRSMMVALAVSIGIPRSMLCWHCSESYHFVEQLPPQLPDPHYPMPRKIATQKHRIDPRTKSHENTWNAKSHLPQNEVFILKSLRRDDTIHRRFF